MTILVGCPHCGEMISGSGYNDKLAVHKKHCPALQRQYEAEKALAEFIPEERKVHDNDQDN